MRHRKYQREKQYKIIVSIGKQKLILMEGRVIIHKYPISTSKYGIGNQEGSNRTPLGEHQIVSKIGGKAQRGEILRNRRRTYKVHDMSKANKRDVDIITSRILRLDGLEKGVNKGFGIDSYKRCIYIHGTAEEHLIGKPASHGCIRMRNRDIIELFRLLKRGTIVTIEK